MFALFTVFFMFTSVGESFVLKTNKFKFPCGESPSISKYKDYNGDIPFQNQLLKIIHGHDSSENDWPWIVALYSDAVTFTSYYCTGAIISPSFVLTAYHCFPTGLVGYGSVHKKNLKFVNIVEKYRFNNSDFGLLKVEKPFEFDGKTVAPICLSSKFDAEPNEILAAAGFGTVFVRNVIIPNKPAFQLYNVTEVLQEAPVQHRNSSWCKGKKFHPETMICIGGSATGVAYGDSGSPIMAIRNNKWYALGELYAGFFESVPNDNLAQITHAWYTKVKPYCNWITEVTHGEVICE